MNLNLQIVFLVLKIGLSPSPALRVLMAQSEIT